MSDPEFPYLVVTARGERVALYARAEMALLMCERLGDGSAIRAGNQVLWRHDAASWDEAHAGEDDGFEMLSDAVRRIQAQLQERKN